MLRVRSAGMDVWEMIATGAPSPRKEAIIETHPEDAPPSDLTHGHALIVWPMKIIKVHMQNNEPGWYPPPGEDPTKTKYTMTVRPRPSPSCRPHCRRCWGCCCCCCVLASACAHRKRSLASSVLSAN